MNVLCINSNGEQLTKGNMYIVFNETIYGYELYNDVNNKIFAEKDKFITLTVKDIKKNLLSLTKLTKLLEDDILPEDCLNLEGCMNNLLSALGYLELMKTK